MDRKRYKDAIDEMNNDFLRNGKEYPSDVPSMMTWLLKRRGGGSSNEREDATSDGVLTSFAQMSFIQRRDRKKMKCAHCGKTGHLAWDCYSLTPAERGEYRAWQSTCGSNECSVGSNASYRSEASHASIRSESSRSASGKVRF